MLRKPWPFADSLRLSAGALLLAMLSHLVEGLTSAVLTFAAAVLALFGAMEFVHAWRWCLPYASDGSRKMAWLGEWGVGRGKNV
jgi:hypothetical protein